MKEADLEVRVGDWVEVKSPEEIALTLDAQGTLDGLPFMPEMTEYCGQRFRVIRRAEKTCVEFPGRVYKMQEFHNNDVVLLDALRCSGVHHDGCQRACVFFWKTRWLRKPTDGQRSTPDPSAPVKSLTLKLAARTGVASGRYFCQSTELSNSTHAISRARVLLKCVADIRSGSRGIVEMLRLVIRPIWHQYVERRFQQRLAVGALTRTPVGSLGLRPGELIRIKSEEEILKTLDAKARNRGLSCDRGMRRFCGGEYRVRHRFERMISEPTGVMRDVEATVILDGLQCLCSFHVGGCPREDFMYWREIWLERVSESREGDQHPVQ